jgi:hypothetical protein
MVDGRGEGALADCYVASHQTQHWTIGWALARPCKACCPPLLRASSIELRATRGTPSTGIGRLDAAKANCGLRSRCGTAQGCSEGIRAEHVRVAKPADSVRGGRLRCEGHVRPADSTHREDGPRPAASLTAISVPLRHAEHSGRYPTPRETPGSVWSCLAV